MVIFKKLIVNGDDFGLNNTINQSIMNLIKMGRMSSATIMVKRNKSAFENAIDICNEMENQVSIGLHIDLDDFFTFDETGHYGINEKDIIERYSDIINKRKKEIEDDIIHQLHMLIDKGIHISHIDGHHSVHQFPSLMEIIIPAMITYDIYAMRFNPSFYCSLKSLEFVKKLIVDNKIKIPDHFIDLSDIISGKIEIDNSFVGIVEIMAHTDVIDNHYGRYDQYNYLMNNSFESAELVSFNELGQVR